MRVKRVTIGTGKRAGLGKQKEEATAAATETVHGYKAKHIYYWGLIEKNAQPPNYSMERV